MPPTVSIIIPTYNRAHLICESLESVFAQTYTDYEVIVVDDGSTDNTEEVLAPYMSRIRYIKQENAGVSAARNHGIFESTGEYIAFLDGDDVWFPEKLGKQMCWLTEHPICFFVCNNHIVGNTMEKTYVQFPEFKTSAFTLADLARKNCVATSSVVLKKEVFYKAGLFDSSLQVGEDYDLWLRIVKHFECYFLEEISHFYRTHNNNTMKDFLKRMDEARARELQSIRWKSLSQESQIFLEHAGVCYSDIVDNVRQSGHYPEATECYWKAMLYYPKWRDKTRFFIRFVIIRFFPFVFRFYDSRKKQH